ncbi:hypothetical protein BGZ73_000540 [Actinomortierella ambigua]|nr:hypothetical protein BGZ73_000540 [Actinomortierella ambigua]
MWGLQRKVWQLLANIGQEDMKSKDQRTKLQVLLIVNHLCVLIGSNQLALPSSEHVVYEFKSSTVSDDACEKQQRKAERLNGAILMDLERQGIDISKYFPVIAEGKGLTIHLYTLRRFGDVLGAGHAIRNPVWLPADLTQLKQFLLSDAVHILVAFAPYIMLTPSKNNKRERAEQDEDVDEYVPRQF